jgi:hypothetical protein
MADTKLQDIADEALAATGSASAAIFLVEPSALRLGAASGVTGDPLERLIAAVQSPGHPIAVTARTGESAFDVTPVAPGGPALRSHIAITDPGGGVLGVLALAHQLPLTEEQQDSAMDLAERAAAI